MTHPHTLIGPDMRWEVETKEGWQEIPDLSPMLGTEVQNTILQDIFAAGFKMRKVPPSSGEGG